jgi:hypothetical protein
MAASWIGRAVAVLGGLLLILSLAANPLGIGTNPREFGWLQTQGAILGCLMLAGGIWLAMRKK